MEKATFLQASAKVQREILFDEIQGLKKGLKVSAFLGGFTSVFVTMGIAIAAKLTFWK